MNARDILAAITAQREAASHGPWGAVLGATADGSELATTKEQKAHFLAASLNDDGAPLWVVENGEVIPAVTGDGPRAGWNAEFIAAAPGNIERLTGAIEAVLKECEDMEAQPQTELAPVRFCGGVIRAAVEAALTKDGQ